MRDTAHAGPAATWRAIAFSTHSAVPNSSTGSSRMTTMRRTDSGSSFHWATNPATRVANRVWPGAGTISARELAETNTVCTCG